MLHIHSKTNQSVGGRAYVIDTTGRDKRFNKTCVSISKSGVLNAVVFKQICETALFEVENHVHNFNLTSDKKIRKEQLLFKRLSSPRLHVSTLPCRGAIYTYR